MARIVSLVPSSTEMLFALGLGGQTVGVTHECDFPAEAGALPRVTATAMPEGLSPGEIDAAVKEIVGEGRGLYSLDERRLAELSPDLIVTQAVCEVCAVSYDDVVEVAARLPGAPAVLQQDPGSLSDVLADLTALGEAAGAADRAADLRAELEMRLAAVRAAVAGAPAPRVVTLEWLDPPYVGGHWVPEMVDLAGGVDVAATAGDKSSEVTWEHLESLEPDVVVVMPCGFYVEESHRQAEAHRDRIAALGADRVVAVDAASAFSRPGPRLVAGTELLAHLLHPDRVPAPAGIGFASVATPRTGSGVDREDECCNPALAVPSCSLDRDGMTAQRDRYAAIGHAATAIERTPHRLAVTLAPSVDRELVEQTLAVERECCPFFDLAFDAGRHRLTIGVDSEEMRPALDAIAYALGTAP